MNAVGQWLYPSAMTGRVRQLSAFPVKCISLYNYNYCAIVVEMSKDESVIHVTGGDSIWF